jgi:hypothetical protein
VGIPCAVEGLAARSPCAWRVGPSFVVRPHDGSMTGCPRGRSFGPTVQQFVPTFHAAALAAAFVVAAAAAGVLLTCGLWRRSRRGGGRGADGTVLGAHGHGDRQDVESGVQAAVPQPAELLAQPLLPGDQRRLNGARHARVWHWPNCPRARTADGWWHAWSTAGVQQPYLTDLLESKRSTGAREEQSAKFSLDTLIQVG